MSGIHGLSDQHPEWASIASDPADAADQLDPEGPIFLGGLEDLLERLENQPGLRTGAFQGTGDALEALSDLLVDAGITR